ncbi:hypothetical protein [Devosia psychrophila]|uniref:TIGR02301 family protein n=1 Tax=Devosia psychrophila TaxID=728005 RepID=A0A0F5PUI4_9HYPH|nr:hypothetical protein [Devosia psychrophila]KKC31484.1 hypothetical protein WH91_18755 [Devosia psychrophila]SFB99511.1 hypothetical protein SAMN04488059_101302 [Devosia psychrophila]
MIRSIAALAVFAVLTGAAVAQEAAPAVPAATDIVVDPAAQFNTSPKQANMLTGFYATQAVIELCSLTVEPAVAEGMAADRARLEAALSLDIPSAEKAYTQVKADVEKTTPDCADGSTDRISVDAVTAIYKAQAAAVGPAAATPVEAATPTTPAETSTPAAPATPAQ